MNNRNDFISDSLERLGTEDPCLGSEKTLARCEEFGWPSTADESKTATLEIIVRKFHRTSVRIRLARDLTENPVAVLRPREHDRRTALGLRQIRKRERNENYGACCRCDHAASSSGRFEQTHCARRSARKTPLRACPTKASFEVRAGKVFPESK